MESEEGRAERKKRAARERIVAAASALFIEKGSRSVSMDEVAAAADVARRTLFNYFPNKEELLYAAAGPVLTEAIALAEARLSGPPPRLEDVVELCLSLWASYGRRLGLIYSVELADSPRLAELHAAYQEVLHRLIGLASGGEAGLGGEARLVGKLVYRSFLPLLLALEGEEDAAGRFRRGLLGLIDGAAGAVGPARTGPEASP